MIPAERNRLMWSLIKGIHRTAPDREEAASIRHSVPNSRRELGSKAGYRTHKNRNPTRERCQP